MKLFLSIICLIGISINGISSENVNYRLNTDIEPINYKIELTPHFENATFDGTVEIELRTAKTNVKDITLHQNGLNFGTKILTSKPVFTNINGFAATRAVASIVGTEYDDVTNIFNLKLSSELEPNQTYILYFAYTGTLRTDMHGFYLSSYQEGNVKK